MEIECEFEDVEWSTPPRTLYTCKVTSCNITERGSAVAAFKGDHDDGENNNSVKALWFRNTKMNYIAQNLIQIFPNLVHLSIYKCELKEVLAEDLIGLEQLEDLNLNFNDITTLSVDLFKNMKNLKRVSFSDNMIQEFDAEILEAIEDTVELFGIQNNPGIDEFFEKKADLDDFIERLKSKKKDSQIFNDLFTSGKYSDFVVKVQGKEFRVHKNILASLSAVFDKIFSDEAGVTSKTFDVFSTAAIEEFLRYFYTRVTPSRVNAAEVLELAVEFDVPDLKLQCETVLVQKINPDSARQLYNFAVQKSLQKLKREAFDVIQEYHPEIEDYIYDKPKIVNLLMEAKEEFQAKKIKLEKEE